MIRLFWNSQAPGDLITGYRIERSVNSGSWASLVTLANSVYTYDDTSVVSENLYRYRLYIVTTKGDFLQIQEPVFYYSSSGGGGS